MSDRRGRLEDDPRKIKVSILPYDDADIDTMLASLQHHAFILRYEARGIRYIQIINFEKHQHPHIKEADSTIPAPCKPRARTGLARLIPDSLNLIPDSGFLKPDGTAAPDEIRAAFDSVWRDYPKRLGRKAAERSFGSSVKSEKDLANIRLALTKYKRHVAGRERQYIQNGSTWFNNWQDWANFEEEKNGANDGKGAISYAALARAKRESEKAREEVTAGAGISGSRDLQSVQAKAESGP